MKQILLSLVNNAVKFTDGGSVNLTAERSEDVARCDRLSSASSTTRGWA